MRFRNGFLLVVLTVLSGCASTPPPIPLSDHDAELEVVFAFPRHGGRLKFQFEAIADGKRIDIGNANIRTNMTREHTKTFSFKKPENLEGLRIALVAKSTISLEAFSCLYQIPIRDNRSYHYKFSVGHNDEGVRGQCWWRRLK